MYFSLRTVFRRAFLAMLVLGSLAPHFALAGGTCHDTDSTLRVYYRECRGPPRGPPDAIPMCDTLYERAGALGDEHMQLVALCLRVDCHYFRNEREHLIACVDRVKEFCRKSANRDFLYYYYFVWSGRLITYYIKQNQGNVAVYEARKMLAEAQADDYPRGMADCYRVLANLYLTQSNYRAAYDNYRREIDIIEKNGIEEINLPTQYASMAQAALELDMPDTALVALRRAEQLPRTPYQSFTVDKGWALYHLYRKDYRTAGHVLRRVERLFEEEPGQLYDYRQGLYYLQSEYYRATGEYEQALEAIARSERDTTLHMTGYARSELEAKQADIYWRMGDMSRAARHYRRYFQSVDSVQKHRTQRLTDDFSGLLEIERLQAQTRELQLAAERRKVQIIYSILGSLLAVMAAGGIFTLRSMTLNRRLRASEATVTERNRELTAAQSELCRAKELAEHASRMKSVFIQNMSHEIRTPLNSVVGFSRVLVSYCRNHPEAAEYAAIVEQGSDSLLRLVDDVLDIAMLDQTSLLPAGPDCQDADSCCRQSIAAVESHVRDGVVLLYEPPAANPVVFMNARRICQVLVHLLHNAVKFTERGQVVLSCDWAAAGDLLRFTVTDTGPGIPPERYEEVFERFVKLDSFIPGTGLGLPICRIIAEKLNGSLTIDPDYASGCRMIFVVPVRRDIRFPSYDRESQAD